MFYLLKRLAKEHAKKRRVAKKLGDNYIVLNEIKENGFNVQYVASKHEQKLRAFIDEEEVVIPFKKGLDFRYNGYRIIGDKIYVAIDQTIFVKSWYGTRFKPITEIQELEYLKDIIDNSVILYKDLTNNEIAYDIKANNEIRNINHVIEYTPFMCELKVGNGYAYTIRKSAEAFQKPSYYTSQNFCYSFDRKFFTCNVYQVNQFLNDGKYHLFQYNGNEIEPLDDVEWDTVNPERIANYFNYIATKDGKTFLLKVDNEFDSFEIPGTAIEPLDSEECEYKNYYKIYNKDKVHLALFDEITKRLCVIITCEGVDIKLSNELSFNELNGQFERKIIVIKEEEVIKVESKNE